MVFHSKVFTIARELVFRERLGEEVSRVELGADVPNANRKIRAVHPLGTFSYCVQKPTAKTDAQGGVVER